MPIFTEIATGRQVDAATATYPGGRCKPGFREHLADGEGVRASIYMIDAAGGIDAAWKSYLAAQTKADDKLQPLDIVQHWREFAKQYVFQVGAEGLTARDSAMLNDAAARSIVDRQHAEHDAKFAFLGDRAPVFDRERALLLAQQKLLAEGGRAVMEMARDSRLDPLPAVHPAAPVPGLSGAPRPLSDVSISAADGASIRDAARAHRYS